MDRFEEALKGLCITDNRSKEAIAPLLKSFLQAAKVLQRALTPIDGSVHAAVSRATNHEDELMTSIDWVSVYDRVGLFDVEDRHVARLVDAALRHVWRKEEYDFLIGSVGVEDNRIIAETRRAMRREEGRGGRAESTVCKNDPLASSMMTMPSLRARVAFSSVRPRVCVPTTAALPAVQAVIKVVADSSHPSSLCRSLGQKAFVAYQSFVIAEAGLTAETVAGVVAAAPLLGSSSTPSAVAAASPLAPGGSSAGGAANVGGSPVTAASTDEAAAAAGAALLGDKCGGRGSDSWKGRGPSAVYSTPPRGPSQNIPIRASKGMTCPDLGEIGFGRGRGFSQVVFPTPLLLV